MREKRIPELGYLDPADWTTEEIAYHIKLDANRLIHTLETNGYGNKSRELLDTLQNYYGKFRSWLQLYGAVTKQEIVE